MAHTQLPSDDGCARDLGGSPSPARAAVPALAKAALPKLVLGDNNFGVDRPGWAWLLPMSYVCLGLPSVRDVARAMPSLACPGTGRVRGPNVACSGGRSPGRKSMLADRL